MATIKPQNRLDFPAPPSQEQQRKEAQNIVDSYSHSWDVVAELAQNAIDAVHKHMDSLPTKTASHEVTLTIDNPSRTITIRDSGCGFQADDQVVMSLLEPHATDKDFDNVRQIGQKGVGLKYVIFMSDDFSLQSQSVSGTVAVRITGAASWRRGASTEKPKLEIQVKRADRDLPSDETFTEVTVRSIERLPGALIDFFDCNDQTQELTLRTKTALGSVAALFNQHQPNEPIKVQLKHAGGGEKQVPFAYLSPAEFANKADVLERDAMVDAIAGMDEAQKRKYLHKKSVWAVKKKQIAGREVRAYAFYAPQGMLREINKRNEFDKLSDGGENEDFGYHAGIFVATRSMPTGIELAPPRGVGSSGYWASLYIIIEDDSLRFDLGRKFVPARTQGSLRDLARDIFEDLTRFSRFFTGGAPNVHDVVAPLNQLSRQDEFAELDKLPDLPFPLSYMKLPLDQEAGVVAIFNELVGRNILRGYKTLNVGYKLQYDWWGIYQLNEEYIGKNCREYLKGHTHLETIMEFKYSGEDIVADFGENKDFIDIDVLVCWDFDEKKLRAAGFMATPLSADNALYHGSNFTLECIGARKLGAAGKVPMIVLRHFLNDVARA